MTANQATYAAILALDDAAPRRVHTLRAKVGPGQQLTNAQSGRGTSINQSEANHEHRASHLPADTRRIGPRSLHPGDVIFWVACMGGAFLLLLSATR